MKEKRQSNFELLRWLLCLTVILYHCRYNIDKNYLFSLFSPYIGAGVCCFALLTGYFSVNKKSYALNSIKLFFTILFYLLILNLIVFLLKFHNDFENSGLFSDYSFFFYGSVNFWYIWALFFLSMLFPFINIIFKNLNLYYTVLFIIIISLIYYLSMENVNLTSQISLPNIILLLVLYSIGACYKIHKDQIVFNSFDLNKILLIFSIVWLITIFLINLILIFAFEKYNFFFGNNNPSSPFTALSFLVITNNIYIKNNFLINYVAKATLPIYIVHYVITKFILEVDQFGWDSIDNHGLTFLLRSTLTLGFSSIIGLAIVIPMDKLILFSSTLIFNTSKNIHNKLINLKVNLSKNE